MFFYQVVFNRPLSIKYTDSGSFTYGSESPISVGSRVIAEFGSSEINGLVVEESKDMNAVYEMERKGITIKQISKVIDKRPILNEDQIELAKWMASYYLASWGECIFSLLPSAVKERETDFSEEMISHFNIDLPQLTEAQSQCIETITQAYTDDSIDIAYLFGVTGSGKTEVFLSAIQSCMDMGKQSIFLVPEIALVLQCYPLFCARFGKDNVAVLHSRLTASQKLTEWNRIQTEEAKVVLGVRSAIFAPVKTLGLVVIDEEHDSSYKSGSTPRYHARQIAMKRCKQKKALLLMGSATPSLEIWGYKDKANMKFMELKERVAGGKIPEIEIISLSQTQGCISLPLREEIDKTLAEDKQVLLLLNRRGFAHSFLCLSCGETIHCPNCSVNLIYHRDHYSQEESLRCHHCGYRGEVPSTCPSCNYVELALKGWGTQRVEEEVQKLFPHASVARMDADIAKKTKSSEDILGKFYRKEIQIMIGTQIMAKGINFPHLKLVGVLFADSLLGIPDFRAEERAFALMTQVAGRAGRFFEGGKVIIQGYGVDNKLFQNIKNSNYAEFFDAELEKRKDYQLSPYLRMLRLVFRGTDATDTEEIAIYFEKNIRNLLKEKGISFNILGPASCAIEKLSNNFRFHVLLMADSQKILTAMCKEVFMTSDIYKKTKQKKVYIEIDPDPVNIF